MSHFDIITAPDVMRIGDHRRNLLILGLAQALLGAQLPILTVLAGLAGMSLSDNPSLATLPIAVQAVGSMTTSVWLSRLMHRHGRRVGFIIGVVGGALGGGICALALVQSSFTLFVFGAYFSGVYMSAQGFYRFAAMDEAPEESRAIAASLVLSGGLVAAVLGTQLAKVSAHAFAVPFLGSYIAIILLNLLGMLLFAKMRKSHVTERDGSRQAGRNSLQLLSDRTVMRAILCGAVSYGLMLLVMTSGPLAIVGSGHGHGAAADVVMSHVLAMFVPSFFTGHLIKRFGAERIVIAGLILLGIAAIVNLSGVEITHFLLGLILLGAGWNFGFIGSTELLATTHSKDEQGRAQGLNDACVFGAVAMASLGSGFLMNAGDGSVAAGWTAVNLTTVPFLILAFVLLIWPRPEQPVPVAVGASPGLNSGAACQVETGSPNGRVQRLRRPNDRAPRRGGAPFRSKDQPPQGKSLSSVM